MNLPSRMVLKLPLKEAVANTVHGPLKSLLPWHKTRLHSQAPGGNIWAHLNSLLWNVIGRDVCHFQVGLKMMEDSYANHYTTNTR